LISAIPFTGGWAVELSSPTSSGLLVIYYPSLVRTFKTSFPPGLTTGRLGSAVAVERVFSGGRDTISLRRASLHPETIRILMLVKKKLHLARAQSAGALRHESPMTTSSIL
jgi:hypothetical protein